MRPKCQWWLAILCNFCKAEISRNPYIIHNLFLSFFLKAPKRYLFKDLSLFHQFRASCRRGVFKILDPKQPALFQRFWAACLQRYVSPSNIELWYICFHSKTSLDKRWTNWPETLHLSETICLLFPCDKQLRTLHFSTTEWFW